MSLGTLDLHKIGSRAKDSALEALCCMLLRVALSVKSMDTLMSDAQKAVQELRKISTELSGRLNFMGQWFDNVHVKFDKVINYIDEYIERRDATSSNVIRGISVVENPTSFMNEA